MTAPTLIAAGRDADVYALDADRVLRRYRDGMDVAVEAAFMTHLHGAGFPVPRVHEASGAELVMQRVPGPTMLQALVAGTIDVEPAADILADLHRRLHAVAPLPGTGAAAPAPAGPAAAAAAVGAAAGPAAAGAAAAVGAGERILHLDVHPDNVILDPRGPVLVDWRNVRHGPPGLDVAMTALILAQVAVDPAQPMAAEAGDLLRAYLSAIRDHAPPLVDAAVAIRRANPTQTPTERALLPTATTLLLT
ncbi:aminoglycoside phosphotransferase family protein [Micromonospora sp. WMMD1082]|uniref:phosphotransferase n=1 Tax=Micromonospora sp. WMMD1082 TaxID=3016104 RepID=UPI0024181314|nr:aminoglycoside phosphotransferase family protein [Micromonospora sp. WMMD1082]MDG4797628.1 aminoglycoside phosphotransferase family protein [Micromonospora sp. WMMD1082]